MLADETRQRPDAETEAERLVAAGFPPGPAPLRLAGGDRVVDEVVESIGPVRPQPAKAAPAVLSHARRAAPGLSPKTLYAALGTGVLALLAVVFILPRIVATSSESGVPVTGTVAAPDDDLPQAESAIPQPDGQEDDAVLTPGNTQFNENAAGTSGLKAATDDALGDLLSQLERLRFRAIERWGGQPYLDAVDVYSEGDEAYIARNYRLAGEKYREASRMLAPFFARIDAVFKETLAAAKKAFDAEDHAEAVRLFDLAVAITPGNREAEAGLERARNLRAVLSLTAQGAVFESNLELEAAKQAFEKALELDAAWQPAVVGLSRVRDAIRNMSFEQRMTEGFESLAAGNFDSARAAFNAARLLQPGSSQPADGLMQLDQEVRLADIRRLETEVAELEVDEQWESAVAVYENILNIDPDLQFAREGLALARSRAAVHKKLDGYTAAPDSLSDPVTMQAATTLLLEISRMDSPGPRISDQKNELSRLLKRAATPLDVQLVSDNLTQVSILKVGRFGNFSSRQVELKPGRYVAVGIRPGYRDVRVEFRVAPEIDLEPIVIQTEEPI
jgi:tetratricopeptide (TPR) repeat protein